MDFHGQKVNLSFSIENILRDDFSHRRRTNLVNLPIRGVESDFERWQANVALYQCCAARYRPVYMKCPPNVHRVEGRLQRPNGGKEQTFTEPTETIDEDGLSRCKGEPIQKENDGLNEKDCKKESKPVKCFNENGPKRKRRNRSHFTQRQLQYLDKIFSRQQYLTRDERTLLARGLEMTELQIRNWFQNRRYQKRHRANEERKQDEPVTSVAI